MLTSLCCGCFDFYPRSPCGERLHYDNYNLHCVDISIHALLAESDHQTNTGSNESGEFLSTLSLRRATIHQEQRIEFYAHFYPRSPCGERRESQPPCERPTTYFYPRSPCGERPQTVTEWTSSAKFLSTLSLRRATTEHQ